MKAPIEIDDTHMVYELFVDPDGGDKIVALEDRTYRVHTTGGDLHYTMVKINGHQRTIRAPLHVLIEALVKVHLVYRRYEHRVRKAKDDAVRARNNQLNAVAELFQ